ncbi:MAG TPA: hypothetical protein VFM11_08710 [Burkholderiales bacterium]|nr:hypothetical protein [Burkholderiales bacterium]
MIKNYLTAKTPRAPRKTKQKNQLQPQRRKGAEERKGKQKQNEIRNSEVLCGFSSRLRASAVIAFLCVSSASLRLCGYRFCLCRPWHSWRLGG